MKLENGKKYRDRYGVIWIRYWHKGNWMVHNKNLGWGVWDNGRGII